MSTAILSRHGKEKRERGKEGGGNCGVECALPKRPPSLSLQPSPTSLPPPPPSSAAAAAAAAPIPTVNNLFDAAKAGDLEAVEDFVAIGRDVNEVDEGMRTPLHFAVAYGHADVARELLSSGAHLDAREKQGNTPLHYACGYGRAELVSLLVGAGADAAAENGEGKTPLELVTGEPRNPLNRDRDTLGALENAEMACAERSGSS